MKENRIDLYSDTQTRPTAAMRKAMAEALDREPPASRYPPDMSKHATRGTGPVIPKAYRRQVE